MLPLVWHILNLKIVYIGKEDFFFLTIVPLLIRNARCLKVYGVYYHWSEPYDLKRYTFSDELVIITCLIQKYSFE